MLGVFTYECLLGELPFQPNADRVTSSGFINIESDAQELRLMGRKVKIPKHLGQHTASLLEGLLDKDPVNRLGVGAAGSGRSLQGKGGAMCWLCQVFNWGRCCLVAYLCGFSLSLSLSLPLYFPLLSSLSCSKTLSLCSATVNNKQHYDKWHCNNTCSRQ